MDLFGANTQWKIHSFIFESDGCLIDREIEREKIVRIMFAYVGLGMGTHDSFCTFVFV